MARNLSAIASGEASPGGMCQHENRSTAPLRPLQGFQVLGNGDVYNHEQWESLLGGDSGLATLMIGRAALIKPWIFTEIKVRVSWRLLASSNVWLYSHSSHKSLRLHPAAGAPALGHLSAGAAGSLQGLLRLWPHALGVRLEGCGDHKVRSQLPVLTCPASGAATACKVVANTA
jgi:Dihydrouridine synthase (Dus)